MNLKAIHNYRIRCNDAVKLFLSVKDNESESNSQLGHALALEDVDCFYLSKIMNLKAIHNAP